MKISLANGVVLNVTLLNEDLSVKSHTDILSESAARCLNLFTSGVLLDDQYRVVARFDAGGNTVGV